MVGSAVVDIVVVVRTVEKVVDDVSEVNAEENVWTDVKSNVGVAIINGSLLVDVGIKIVVQNVVDVVVIVSTGGDVVDDAAWINVAVIVHTVVDVVVVVRTVEKVVDDISGVNSIVVVHTIG